MRENERRRTSTPASGDGTASTTVGVGLSSGPAIVIGSATSRARDGIPPKRTIAYVPPPC